MDERLAAALRLFPDYAAQHVLLSAAALALGLVLSLPLGLYAARHARARGIIVAAVGIVQTIPGLALLALFYPLLLALSALSLRALGVAVPALGFLPALLALALYAMLPVVRNVIAGLDAIAPAIIEAADGVGMTPRQRLWRVEVPLAAPVAMAGIRTAAVWTIGAATLSTTVGQTSLGNFIFSGLQTEDWIAVLVGCGGAVVLALVADRLLGLIEAGIVCRERKTGLLRIVLGAAGLALGTILALVPVMGHAPRPYVIGAKNFSEQFILASLMADRLHESGVAVERKQGLGSAVIFRALAGSDIDAYVDYSGTLWTTVMQHRDVPERAAMNAEITRAMKADYGVTVLGALGFENAYALAMKSERAAALGITSIADLARHAPQLTLGSDLEFLNRPEWAALRAAYGLDFAATRAFSPTFMYRALDDGSVDVISAFSSDGRIAAERLTVLSDPAGAIPAYDALILISPRRAGDSVLRRALLPLVGAISVARMREANLMVDRDTDKKTPQQAAAFLRESLALPR